MTAIFPLLIIGSFLFNEINNKLNERFASLFSTSRLLVSERYRYDLEKLELINNEISYLSIGEELESYLKDGSYEHLEMILNKFQESRDLAIVALVNSQKKVLASTDTFEDASKDSLNKLIEIALQGHSVSSIERLRFSSSKKTSLTDELMYVAASPIYSSLRDKKVIGVLLVGHEMKGHNSFKELTNRLPILKIEVLDERPGLAGLAAHQIKTHNFSSSNPSSNQETFYDQKIDGHNYKSSLLPLTNYSGYVVGYLEVSISSESERQLEAQNSLYLLIGLVLAIIGIILAGYWFNRNFVDPMNQITGACNKLAHGDWNAQISPPKGKTDMRRTIEQFNRMVRQLQEKEQMQDTFISTLTHDLRTPLLAQKRVFELLEEEFESHVSDDLLRLTQGLNTNNQHLLNMVNLLVETYKYDSEGVVLDKKLCLLSPLMHESLATLRPLIDSKNIKVINSVKDNLPAAMLDEAQLKRVLINIISNAVENIPPSHQIEISAENTNDHLEIKISDDGYGIPPEILPHIFDKFFSRNKTKQKVGSGLGLFICKLLVEAHEGTISVESIPQEGTTFTIKIPKGS